MVWNKPGLRSVAVDCKIRKHFKTSKHLLAAGVRSSTNTIVFDKPHAAQTLLGKKHVEGSRAEQVLKHNYKWWQDAKKRLCFLRNRM